ncbi:MAG TPA: SRPBCC domain-containing protein [Thermodesulfobacteriota bacterium]|nr:SRPBCC domain-containing protein [Thermodesulfobacteriota bacterium]
MRVEKQVTIRAGPEAVWAFLWDVERLAGCIPGCREARTVEPKRRYAARVEERIGPFKAAFPLDIEVLEAEAPRRLAARASGRDSALASAVKVELRVELAGRDGGETELHLAADVSVLGKLGTLGHGAIVRRADEIVAQFAEAIRQRLERPEGPGRGAAC